jgi:hypothetical protein
MGNCCSSIKKKNQRIPKIIISNRLEIKREQMQKVAKIKPSDRSNLNKENFENISETIDIKRLKEQEDIVVESDLRIRRINKQNIRDMSPFDILLNTPDTNSKSDENIINVPEITTLNVEIF